MSGIDGIPIICRNCGYVGPGPEIFRWGVIGASLHIAGSITNCVRCGGPAEIADGHYGYTNAGLEFFGGPPLTRAIVDRLRKIAENARQKAKEGSLKTEELLAEVADVSPELAKKLRAKHAFPVVALILLLIWMIRSVNLDIKVDLNRLIDQAIEYSEKHNPDEILADPPDLPEQPKPAAPPNPNPAPVIAAAPAFKRGKPNRRERRKQKAQARKGKPKSN